jgi:hypothetical protein
MSHTSLPARDFFSVSNGPFLTTLARTTLGSLCVTSISLLFYAIFSALRYDESFQRRLTFLVTKTTGLRASLQLRFTIPYLSPGMAHRGRCSQGGRSVVFRYSSPMTYSDYIAFLFIYLLYFLGSLTVAPDAICNIPN